ncbi:unnamed protein product, partial [Prorocentrum cordatum]
ARPRATGAELHGLRRAWAAGGGEATGLTAGHLRPPVPPRPGHAKGRGGGGPGRGRGGGAAAVRAARGGAGHPVRGGGAAVPVRGPGARDGLAQRERGARGRSRHGHRHRLHGLMTSFCLALRRRPGAGLARPGPRRAGPLHRLRRGRAPRGEVRCLAGRGRGRRQPAGLRDGQAQRGAERAAARGRGAGRPLRRPPPWAGRGPAAERLPPGRGQPALCGRARGPAARADAVRGRGPRRPRHHLPHPARGACPPGRRRGVHHRRRVPEPGPQRARGARLGAHRLRLRGRRLRPGPRAGRGGVRRGPRGPRRPVLARLARRARRLRRDVRPARGARGRGHAPRKRPRQRPLASCRSAGSRGPSGGRGTPTSPGPTRRRPRRGS